MEPVSDLGDGATISLDTNNLLTWGDTASFDLSLRIKIDNKINNQNRQEFFLKKIKEEDSYPKSYWQFIIAFSSNRQCRFALPSIFWVLYWLWYGITRKLDREYTHFL